MKRLAPLILAVPLLLAGCSNSSNDVAGTITPVTPPPSTTAKSSETPKEGSLGTPVNIATFPGNEVNLTITEITVGEECRYGTNDYGGSGDPKFGKLEEGQQYLQAWAEVDVVALASPQTHNDWIILNDPEIVDKDGFTQMVQTDMDCRDSDEGHQMWLSTVDEGDRKKLYDAFVIPEEAKEVRVMGIPYSITETTDVNVDDSETTPEKQSPSQ